MKLLGYRSAGETRSTSVQFFNGDVLYGRMRPYLNKVWVAEFDGLCSSEFLVFPKVDGLNSEFLAHRLNSEDFVAFANNHVAGERPRVDFDKLSHFPILLPPTFEQDRIVAKLVTALSRLERGKAAAMRATDRLDKYRKVVIDAAIKGDLTARWRMRNATLQGEKPPGDQATLQDILARRYACWRKIQGLAKRHVRRSDVGLRYPEPTAPSKLHLPEIQIPEGWIWIGWDQVGLSQNGRAFPSKEYTRAGTKLLRPGNLYSDGSVQWNERNTRCVPARMERSRPDLVVRGNELIINLTAQSLKDEFLGRVCLTSPEEHCLLNQRLARLTPVVGIPRFFLYVFKSSVFRKFVDGLNSGSLIQHIFTSQLAEFVLPLPPAREQAQIVREAERRLSTAMRIQRTLQQQVNRSMRARQSILDAAFSGRLAAQEAGDGDASLLLARISDVRAAEVRSPKARNIAMKDAKPTIRRSLIAILKERGRPMSPEDLFRSSGYPQDAIDEFFSELRELTDSPPRIVQERGRGGRILLKVAP